MRRPPKIRALPHLAVGALALALALSAGCGSLVLQPGAVGDPPLPGEQTSATDIPSILTSFSDWIRPDELIVKYVAGTPEATVAAREAEIGVRLVKQDLGGLLRLLALPGGTSLQTALLHYAGLPEVEYAEPNLKVVAPEPAGASASEGASVRAAPNDPLYPQQWHLQQIGIEEAWQRAGGGQPSTVVAIVDTGVAYETWSVYTRADDLAGAHFVAGYDFANGDTHPNDDQGHGTHVAGTIAQTTGNGLGCAGVAPSVSVMPVKVLDYLGSGTSYDVAQGIRFAVDNGADVINLSLGGPAPDQTMRDACQYAYDGNVVVVCAAGNEGGAVGYPAGYSTTLCVSATDFAKNITTYSSRGPEVDVAAPGGDTDADLNADGHPDGVLQQTFRDLTPLNGFDYEWLNGTSMATPHVAGAVALLLSNGLSTANNTEAVRNLFAETCEDRGDTGRDPLYGYGLLRIDRALASLAGGQPPSDPQDPWDPPSGGDDDAPPLPGDALVLRPGEGSPWVQLGSPVDALPGQVFSAAPDNLLTWIAATQRWTPTDRLATGGGVFVSLSAPISLYFDTRNRISPAETVTVALRKGWNVIGNPYDRAMPWNGDAIKVARSNGTPLGSLNEAWDNYQMIGYGWMWEPDAAHYVKLGDPKLVSAPEVLTALPIYRGAWVRALEDNLVLSWTGLELEASNASARGRDARLDDPGWQRLLTEMKTATPPPAPPS